MEKSIPPTFAVGDSVEAKFHGGAEFFSGEVIAVRPAGRFHVLFSDGDEDTMVKASDMKLLKRPEEKKSTYSHFFITLYFLITLLYRL